MSNGSMNCGQVRRQLPPFLDEELSGRKRDALASHLASCPACRAELETLKADMELIEQVPAPELSPFVVTRVLADIRQRRGANANLRSPTFGVRRLAFGVGLARLAASLAAALVVAVSVGAGVFFGSGLAQASTAVAANSTEAAVSYVESSTASMYSLMSGGD